MRLFSARHGLTLAALCLPMLLVACDDDDSTTATPTPAGDVVSVVSADARLSILTAAVVRVGLEETLQGEGPFTLFAPVDGAFAGVDVAALDDDTLRAILSRHVVSGRFEAEQVIAADTLTALDGTELKIEVNDGAVTVNGAAIQETDISATNGVIHLTTAIVPEAPEVEMPMGTLAEVLSADARFATVVAAADAAGLVDTLADPDAELTVFAPTEAAFAALPEGALDDLLADTDALTAVLTLHVASGRLSAAEVIASVTIDTLGGAVAVENTEDGVRVGGALVIEADLQASNGVVHAIDAVILPPEAPPANDIVSIAINDGRFETLVAAVDAAGLVETLQGEGPFTVFAPTDDAFAALPEGTVEALLEADNREQLIDILTYHVIDGAVGAEAVAGQSLVTMLNGDRARVRVEGDTVRIGDATIVVKDIAADNGIIHVIDTVLLPPADLVATLEADGRFGTLLAAVGAAGIADALDGVTVFAPTDDAFAALPEGTVDMLLMPENRDALIGILTFHVVADDVPAADALERMTFSTAAGFNLFVRATDEGARVNEAGLIDTDVPAHNGLIHVVDTVLLPPANLVDVAADAGQFSTLIAAVEAAGLVEALTDPEANFAVFAPTDAAFAALPEGALDALLADPEALAEVLLYHVVPGAPDAATVTEAPFLPTAGRTGFAIQAGPDGVRIGDATVIITDIPAPNGVIHVIDAVLLPPANIVDTAREAGAFNTLLAALEAATLTGAIADGGPFTVFAPTDDAFAALPEGTVEALLNDIPALTAILQFHVVPGLYPAASLSDGAQVQTLSGDTITIGVGAEITAAGATVITPDVWTGNGIIHIVGSVLMPPQ